MKVAMVVPPNLQALAPLRDRPYNMCLAQHVLADREYAQFFRGLRKQGNSLIMMDNGAAEEASLSAEDLVRAAIEIGPHELVLPDCPTEERKTASLSLDFLIDYCDKLAARDIGVSVVLQGKTLEDIAWSARHARMLGRISKVGSVCLPMLLEPLIGSRLEVISFLLRRFDDIPPIHLLGLWNDPYELMVIERRYPGLVRGCDTSWPYVAAQHKVSVLEPRARRTFLPGIVQCPDYNRVVLNVQLLDRLAGSPDGEYEYPAWKGSIGGSTWRKQ